MTSSGGERSRILFVDHATIVGGGQLALAAHLRMLDRDRFDPIVACTDAVPELAAEYRAAGAEVHTIVMPRLRGSWARAPWRLAVAARGLRTLARHVDADVVVANTSRAAYVATLAVRGMRVPLVWWVRDFLFDRAVFRAAHRAANKIICVSNAVRRFYGGEQDARFDVVHVGTTLDSALAKVSTERVRAERERFGVQDDDVLLGFMGRLVADKGPEDVIEAVVALHAANPRIKLLLVGAGKGQPGDVDSQLRARVAERGWSFVRFAGFQRDEALYYSCFDLFVHATRVPDAYPTSIVQAMMTRVPVIATETGGTPELVRDDVTGLLVSPSAPPAIAAAVARLVDDGSLRHRLARVACAEVMEHNREAVTTAQVERIYDGVLAARGRRSRMTATAEARVG